VLQKRSRADRVHHTRAHPFRIETGLREKLGKYRLVTGADLRPAYVVRTERICRFSARTVISGAPSEMK